MNSKLVIGISSRALFDLSQSHQIFEKNGIEAYRDHQIQNENEILESCTKIVVNNSFRYV